MKMTLLPKPFTDSVQSQSKSPSHSLQKWRGKYSKMHMETQKTLESQNNPEQKEAFWGD